MPIYEYSCGGCGHVFEELVRNPDEHIQCPQCDSQKVERLPSAFGGYQGSFGGGSTRPKHAGSFKRAKK